MNQFDYSSIKIELIKFENTNVCNVCFQKFVNPVRIKICGHYFCEECLFNSKYYDKCPKCNVHFEKKGIDYENTARKMREHLKKLKNILNSVETEGENKPRELKTNSFIYKSKVYHVNYADELFKKVNTKGESPLHIACKKKKLQDVRNLLKKDIDVNMQDFAGWTPLHEAVESKSLEITELLLEHGALIDVLGAEYTTPLHKAAMLNSKELIELLLKYAALKNVCDYFGKKPIDYLDDQDIKPIFETDYKITDRIEELFCSKNIVAYLYYIEKEFIDKLKGFHKARIENEFDPKKVTHFFIRKTHKPAIKIYSAMVNGILIVPQEYINHFIEDQYFFDITTCTYILNYELNKGIQQAMLNSYLKLPQLFDGIRFFIHGHKSKISVNEIKITKEELVGLITDGGGKMLPRAPTPRTCEEFKNFPYHANLDKNTSRCCHYIIYEENDPPAPLYKMPDIKHKTSNWLINCVTQFCIID